MFEKYTIAARKIVFDARYEASVSASPEIRPEHLLLGLLRSDEALALRVFGSHQKVNQIRQRFEKPAQPSTPLGVDLPLSDESKRVLAYATEESERLNHAHIGTADILVGLGRVPATPVTDLMQELGLSIERLQQESARRPDTTLPTVNRRRQLELARLLSSIRRDSADEDLSDRSRDLTALASGGQLGPLVGRQSELERMLQILLRRYRNWVALTGEEGVGKTALLEGLAQHLMDGIAHPLLGGRTVVSIEAAFLPDSRNLCEGSIILCVEGLFDLSAEEVRQVVRTLQAQARQSDARIIATGSPEGFRRLPDPLAHLFEPVALVPPDEAETLQILTALKSNYEHFHSVTIADEAIGAAVTMSRKFLSSRLLPDRALDLLDDACSYARVKHKQELTAADIAAAMALRTGARVSAAGAQNS